MTPFTVPFTDEQVFYAKELATKIIKDKREARYTDMACRDPGEAALIGYLGETIYSDFYFVPRPELMPGRVDYGYDLELDGQFVQVKTTDKPPPNYITLFPHHANRLVDIFALVVLDRETKTATIHEVAADDFFDRCYKHDWGFGTRIVYRIGGVEWARK